MDEFIKEIREMPTADLTLIIEDQKDLYTEEEYQALLDEFASRPGNAIELEEKEAERKAAEKAENARKQAYARQIRLKVEELKSRGLDGYWEYKVLSLSDAASGSVNPYLLERTLNEMGLDGWHLNCAYANELGQNMSSSGIGGFSTGTNATIDQNILILERFVKIE